MLVSIVIRTYNEEAHLDEVLKAIKAQDSGDLEVEIIIVDSGSSISIDSSAGVLQKSTIRKSLI